MLQYHLTFTLCAAALLACAGNQADAPEAPASRPATRTPEPASTREPDGERPAGRSSGDVVTHSSSPGALACESDDLGNCFSVATAAYDENPDKAPAIALMRSLCQQKDALSCHRLGIWIQRQADGPGAAQAWLRGCEIGHQDSCVRAAKIFAAHRKYGMAADWPRVFALSLGACDAREMSGCLFLANLYEYGQGTTVDKTKARHYKDLAVQYGY